MRIVRYLDRNQSIHFGAERPDGTVERLSGDILTNPRPTGETADVAKILAPLVPAAILCIGLNYRRHADEGGKPVPDLPILFFKAPNALQNPGDPIMIPRFLPSDEVDYECELVIVIGKAAKNVTREKALDYVLGYTCGNDVSARDWQLKKGGGQWSRGKTFDTFAPLGPCIVTTDEIPNPNTLAIKTHVNGRTMQDWNTSDMIFDVPTLIEFLSGSTTLLPGTVIFTGTPHGVGMGAKPPHWLQPGDTVSIEIEKIGTLTNPVIHEPL